MPSGSTPKRWLGPAERGAYLAEACGGDHDLRREVESLLMEAERCGQFLSSAGFESALRSIAGSDSVPLPRAEAGAAAPAPRRPAFFWFAIACGIAISGMWASTAYVAYRNTGGRDFGWESLYSRAGWTAVNVYTGGPADGKLRSGDRFLAFNGDTRATRIGPDAFRQFLRPGSDYSIRVLRHGETHEYRLRVQPWQDWGSYPWAATYLILSLVNLSTGLAMALLKPRDSLARLGFATLGLAAVRNLASPLSAHPGTPPDMEFVLNQLAGLTFPAVLAAGYHFIHRISAASAKEFVWLAIQRLLYGVTAIVTLSQILYFAATLRGPATLIGFAFRYFWIVELNLVFLKTSWEAALAMAFGSICALIVWGYGHSQDADYRRRIRWFAAGCTAGIAPAMLLNLIGWLLAIGGHRAWLLSVPWDRLRWVADQFMIALPAALTYGVLKHRLLDIRVVVRRGLRYMLARRMLQAILILPFLGLTLPIVSHPDKSLIQSLRQSSSIVNLVLLALTGLVLRYRVPMRMWLDRRFFRETYQQEDILRRLIARIKDLDSLEGVSKLVCNELDLALHPSWLYVCQWEDKSGRLAVVQASARGAIESVAAVPAGILDLLQACASSRTRESSAAAETDSLVAVPISTNNASAGGALLLGEKKSEEPYTETDRRLLQGVADAIAIAWENLWLKKRVDQGLSERLEVLSRLKPAGITLLKECPVCGACFDSDQQICPVDSAELILSLPVERTIGRRYWLEKRIGKGGMGVVFEATDLSLSRKVAVKIMLGHLFGETTALRRFEREARILAQLSHPNVVAIHDFGSLGEDGAYLVMERLSGRSWRRELQRMGKIPYAVAASWFDQLLAGLTAAHAAGIVHRDLKPENVIVTAPERDAQDTGGGLVKILDFGVAKANALQSPASASLTEAGVVIGTLAYMSPEQLRGGPADQRADIFSVGIMAAEAVTGRLPGRSPNDGTVLAGSITGQLPTRLADLVLSCVRPDPNDRCASLAAFHKDLVAELRACETQSAAGG
jgi:hypothetical protein